MSCKYCFQNDHTIEQCKTILCRVCKEIGHPHWLCAKDKKSTNNRKIDTKAEIKKVVSKPMLSPKASTSNVNPIEKKVIITVQVPETKRDIQFYLKQSTRKWSEIL